MDKDVIISVRGTQRVSPDNEGNGVELVTEGKYCKRENAYYVIYTETEMTGFEGTITTLKITDDIVTLSRTGTTNSQLIFEQGHKHVSYYDTANGAYTIGVYANKVNVDMDDSGGEISIDYSLEIDNNKTGDNDFHVLIREAKPNTHEASAKN